MTPILFAENAENFNTNGIGRLSDAIRCDAIEERNGQDELELVYPITGAHFSDIGMRSIVYVKPSQKRTPQPFRVYKISAPISGKVTINARHRRYDLGKNTSMPISEAASASACNNALQKIKNAAVESCPFTFWTDVTTVASYIQKIPRSILQSLGGTAGSILDQFGGEYEYDNLTVKLWKNRGSEIDYRLSYGKNITDITQEKNISDTITGVVPYWSDMDGNVVVTLPEKAVYSPNASLYSQKLTVPLDLSGDYQDAPTVATLRAAANTYIAQAGIGIPKVSIDISFVALWDTEEYKGIAPLQQAGLCDIVPIDFEPLGITGVQSKIVKVVYDCLKERYKSMTLGSLRSSLATAITDQTEGIQSVIARQFTQTEGAIQNATAWLTSSGGYVIAVKNSDGTWKELLFMDSNDVATAHNVLRVNENGIGFSSTGVSGPYTQAWTLDGRLVIGGTNVPSITVHDSQGDIIFQASATAIVWNAANSSMSASGTITAKNATLTGGTLNLGGQNNGVIRMYDSRNRLRGEWTKSGFTMYNASGTTIFSASSDVSMRGSLHCGDDSEFMDISGTVIKGNDDSYIDFEGSVGYDNGIHFNTGQTVFSVDDIGVTNSRNGSAVHYGQTGTFGGLYFRHGICTSLSSEEGANGTVEYRGLDGNTHYIYFSNGLCTGID